MNPRRTEIPAGVARRPAAAANPARVRTRIAIIATALQLFLGVGLLAPTESHAQTDRRGAALRTALGGAYAGASLDDGQPAFDQTAVFTWGAQVWGGISRTVGFEAELVWQPTHISNPRIEQAFSALYLMGGPEFSFGQMYVRPSAGVVWLYWTGAQAKQDTDNAFAWGLAIGSERKVDKAFHLVPEVLTRMSFESGLFTWMVGFQLGLGWRSNPY